MDEDQTPIEYRLVRDGTLLDFEVVDSKIEPTVGDEDWHVRLELLVDDELIESCAFGLIFVLGMFSFHDGRPRGYSGEVFVDDDHWTAADMLACLRFEQRPVLRLPMTTARRSRDLLPAAWKAART
jgi:hypothetical protein